MAYTWLIDWFISHSYLEFGPKSSWSRLRHYCIAAWASSSSTFMHFFWGLTNYLIRAPRHCLTLIAMNDALCRWALDKGCTYIMYMNIEYQNHRIISLLTQPVGSCVNVLRLRNYRQTDTGTHRVVSLKKVISLEDLT